MKNSYIYLDNNATTPIHPEVLDAMLPYLKEKYGNPSSIHSLGREAQKAVEESRYIVAKFINAEVEEIIFTSGGTEADNLAICGLMGPISDNKNHIITSQIEHPAVLAACKHLEEKEKMEVTYISPNQEGAIDVTKVEELISEKTALISIMFANNEIGTIGPIEKIAQTAKKYGALFHTDAIQAAGKIEINVKKLGVDALTLSSHKIYGPKGIGAVYIKKGIKIQPTLYGGHQEMNLRAGTENVPAIVGFAKACEWAQKNLSKNKKRLQGLRDYLEENIKKNIPQLEVIGQNAPRLCNTSNMAFHGKKADALLIALDMEGIIVSGGSACSSGVVGVSPVLKAMKIPEIWAQGAIRFSLGIDNTREEIDKVVDVLSKIVNRIK